MFFYLSRAVCFFLLFHISAYSLPVQDVLDTNTGLLNQEESRRVENALKDYLSSEELKTADAVPLSGGWMNKMFKVETPYQTFVLRIMDLGASLEARYHEVAVSALAAHKKLSPKLLYSDREATIMLIEFIPGRNLQYDSDEDLRTLLDLIIKWHETPLAEHVIDQPQDLIARMMNRYKHCIKKSVPVPKELQSSLVQADKINQAIHELFSDAVLCHNDLHCRNVMVNSHEAKLIDWTLASYQDPFYDLASIATYLLLDDQETEWMLSYYLGRSLTLREEQLWTLIRPLPILIFAVWAFYSIDDVPPTLCPEELWASPDLAMVNRALKMHATGEDPEMDTEYRYRLGCALLRHYLNSVNTNKYQKALNSLVLHPQMHGE